MSRFRRYLCSLIVSPIFVCLAPAQTPKNIGDIPDGNKSVAVHLIKLYDEFDHVIRLDDRPVMPFSTKQTCNKCHDYEKIRHGWHFNAADSGVNPGRRGEPWILVDRQAGIQVPLSYRNWKGTFRPETFGLSSLKFLTTFGHHLPGGGVGEVESHRDLNDYMRWQVSGNLDVNCQSCHNGDAAQSPAEYGVQVLRQNFRWAATASSGFATVQGSAAEMPDNFDLYSAVSPEKTNFLPPTLTYNRSRFDIAGKVLFDVPRKMPASQCAFCHSSKVLDSNLPERWTVEEDVHLAAGMVCVDCHRAGIDHRIVRGYEAEAKVTGRSAVASLTCKGCHLGNSLAGGILSNGRRAPRPQHLGIPPIHFEKLACTACHSGPWPSKNTYRVKTSEAHALGIPTADKSDDALPQIVTPVFAKQEDGTYAPHDLVWPSFWAFRQRGTLTPILPDLVRPLVLNIVSADSVRLSSRWTMLNNSEVMQVLKRLHSVDSTAGTPVYVAAGKLFELSADGSLMSEDDKAASPYLWPIAHDVRPKSQSLGALGCTDCHATDAPFYFGSVSRTSPFVSEPDSLSRMTAFLDKSVVTAWLFSSSFLFRPGLKFIIIVSFLLLLSVIVIYALKGLGQVLRAIGEEKR